MLEEKFILTIGDLKVNKHTFISAQRKQELKNDGTTEYYIEVIYSGGGGLHTQGVCFDSEENRNSIFASIEF